jgi:drug/metabolite transporter (DMT)-like permease
MRRIAQSGELLALAALFFGTVSGVFLKSIEVTPSNEAVALRTVLAFALLGAMTLIWPKRGAPGMGRIGVARAVLDAIAALSFAFAIFTLPLSLLASILATLPLVSVTLSALILSEPLSRRTWIAIVLAFLGTLLILKPGLGFSVTGIVLAFVATFAFALRDVATKRLPEGTDTRRVVLLSFTLVGIVSAAMTGTGSWSMPPQHDIVLIVLAAVTSLCSTVLIVQALRLQSVGRIAPLRYTSVLWSLLFDALIWSYVPDVNGWAGIALILIAGGIQHSQTRKERSPK